MVGDLRNDRHCARRKGRLTCRLIRRSLLNCYQLLANYSKPEDLAGGNGLFKQLEKALIERPLGAELTEHLGYEKADPGGRGTGNHRNGTSSKTILTEDGEIELAVARDRAGSFEPQPIAEGRRGSMASTTRS